MSVYQYKKKKQKEKMDIFIRNIKRKNKGKYDCVVGFSGGKDSTYLLNFLKEEYDLNILAYTCDTQFMSEVEKKNIEKVVDKLKVDHIWSTPGYNFYKKLYSYFLTHPVKDGHLAAVCKRCFGATKLQTIKLSAEKNIPLVAYGVTPAQSGILTWLYPKKRVVLNSLFLDKYCKNFFKMPIDEKEKKCFKISFRYIFKVPNVLAPFSVLEYDLNLINQTNQRLNLIAPGDEEFLCSNCFINLLLIDLDYRKFGYSPYMEEYSKLVRWGLLSKDQALSLEENMIEQIKNSRIYKDKIRNIVQELGILDYYTMYVENHK